jgi:cation:H+ antiporter
MPELAVFAISIPAVIVGADWVGNAATTIAKNLSLPRVIIGSTLVALATTIPEISISLISGFKNTPVIGEGAALGSPVVNIGLIFGILLLFSKKEIQRPYFVRTVQILLVVLAAVFFISIGGRVSQTAAAFLILLGLIYLLVESLIGRHEEGFVARIEEHFSRLRGFFGDGRNLLPIFYLIIGFLLLVIGAYYLVESTVVIASILKVPVIFISLAAISLGTSMPELITTVNSIFRGRVDLSTGNLFGASVLNLSLALGAAAIFGGLLIDQNVLYLTTATLGLMACVSLFLIFGRISPRVLGGLLIAAYFVFLGVFTLIET